MRMVPTSFSRVSPIFIETFRLHSLDVGLLEETMTLASGSSIMYLMDCFVHELCPSTYKIDEDSYALQYGNLKPDIV